MLFAVMKRYAADCTRQVCCCWSLIKAREVYKRPVWFLSPIPLGRLVLARAQLDCAVREYCYGYSNISNILTDLTEVCPQLLVRGNSHDYT